MKQRLVTASSGGLALALLLTGAAVWCWLELRPLRHAPGILIEEAPVMAKGTPQPIPAVSARSSVDDFRLTRLATYRVQGRVLSVQRYYDHVAALAPVDVVLGWQEMSDSAVLAGLSVNQQGRRFSLDWPGKEGEGLPLEEAMQRSANFHLIPGDDAVAALLGRLKPGMLVDLGGSLVEAEQGAERWPATLSPAPEASHNRLLYLQKAEELPAKKARKPGSSSAVVYENYDARDLKRWYEALEQQRRELDPEDAVAVREFNREAGRYMRAAHPQRSLAPASRQSTPVAPPQ